MGADFSRVRFNPLRDYAGVELQQGRVLTDADANELMAITDRRLRALASDTLGRATVSSMTPDGFKLTLAAGALQILDDACLDHQAVDAVGARQDRCGVAHQFLAHVARQQEVGQVTRHIHEPVHGLDIEVGIVHRARGVLLIGGAHPFHDDLTGIIDAEGAHAVIQQRVALADRPA